MSCLWGQICRARSGNSFHVETISNTIEIDIWKRAKSNYYVSSDSPFDYVEFLSSHRVYRRLHEQKVQRNNLPQESKILRQWPFPSPATSEMPSLTGSSSAATKATIPSKNKTSKMLLESEFIGEDNVQCLGWTREMEVEAQDGSLIEGLTYSGEICILLVKAKDDAMSEQRS